MRYPLQSRWWLPALAFAGFLSTSGAAQRQPVDRAADVLNVARARAGGASALAAVQSLHLAGVSHQGEQLPVELRLLLPDHYVRLSVIPAGGVTQWGRAGATPLVGFLIAPSNASSTVPPPVEPDFLDRADADLARLVLLYLLRTDTAVPLTLAERVDKREGLIAMRFNAGGQHFAAVDIDAANGLPVRLRHTVTPISLSTGVSMGSTEIVTTVVERRVVQGLNLPSRVRSNRGTDVTWSSMAVNTLSVGSFSTAALRGE